MISPKLINPSSLPTESHLLIPSRLNIKELKVILTVLKDREVTVLAEETGNIDDDLLEFIKESGLAATAFSADDEYLSDVGRELESRIGSNGLVIYIPPAVNTAAGGPIDVPSNFLNAVCELGLPVCSLAVHRPVLNKLRFDSLSQDPESIMVLGKLLRAPNLTVANIMQEVLIGAEKAFSSRSFLKGSLGAALLRTLYDHGKENTIFDGNDNGELTYHKLMCASLALSDFILKQTTKMRVGVVLPPGKGGLIANLAILFAGKIPVNLNFTSSKEAVKSCMKQADMDVYITAQAAIDKLPAFPWPEREELILLDQLVKKLKPMAAKWMLKTKLFSADKIIEKRGLEQRYDQDEAVLLFTSGSSGLPKGVPLSHRNILSNVCQFGTRIECPEGTKLLGCLPLFHSFGCTVTTFFPLLQGHDLVTYPSPLENKKLGQLIEEKKVTLLTATPTFLRGYLKRVKPEQLKTLDIVVTGAEKLPVTLATNFEKRFNKNPEEGYGLTETSPASHLNVPSTGDVDGSITIETSRRGTVGMPLVGVAMRMTDPMTGQEIPIDQKGCLWLKGANVFKGYLGKPELHDETFEDGWFNTGDIGRVDEDGFLSLEGRLSRFSKIGGEMVPHETVELEVHKILDLDDQEDRKVAIMGIPDEKKGEALLLLTSLPEYDAGAFINDLRKKLIATGVPALWCPKTMVYVPQIPILGSGKLDIAACRKVADEVTPIA